MAVEGGRSSQDDEKHDHIREKRTHTHIDVSQLKFFECCSSPLSKRTLTCRLLLFSAFSEAIFFPPNFGSRSDDPSPNASLHERVFLYRKEHLATVVRTVGAMDGNPSFSVTPAAASLRTAGAGFWALRVATLRVSNCEQMFADSGVILCVHSVGSETKTVIVCCLVV